MSLFTAFNPYTGRCTRWSNFVLMHTKAILEIKGVPLLAWCLGHWFPPCDLVTG